MRSNMPTDVRLCPSKKEQLSEHRMHVVNETATKRCLKKREQITGQSTRTTIAAAMTNNEM
jgi:hypothetical protein